MGGAGPGCFKITREEAMVCVRLIPLAFYIVYKEGEFVEHGDLNFVVVATAVFTVRRRLTLILVDA